MTVAPPGGTLAVSQSCFAALQSKEIADLNHPSLAHTSRQDGRQPYLVYLIAMVAAVGGFLFGYDLPIISGAKLFLEQEFSLEPMRLDLPWAARCWAAWPVPSSAACSAIGWGRKRTLIFAGLLFAAGSIGSALPANDPRIRSVPIPGRRRRGAGVGRLAHVHRRDVAAAHPRGAGDGQPIGDRGRLGLRRGRLLLLVVWRTLAMDAGLQRRAGAALHRRPAAGAGKPALDGAEEPAARGPGRADADRRAADMPRPK